MKDLTLPAPKGSRINWRDYIIYMEDGHIVEISDEDEIFDTPKDERTRRFLRRFI